MRLEHMVSTLNTEDGEFPDPRINSLWNMAQKSNWSQEKLDSFKVMLILFFDVASKLDALTHNLLVCMSHFCFSFFLLFYNVISINYNID